MLPDTGERYLSTPLFEDIGEEMNDEEVALSKSTPGYRFDIPPAEVSEPDNDAAAHGVAMHPAPDADAERLVDELVEQEPVVMFALEWCEFCWSARKLFAKLGIEYRSVDLDSVEYQQGDLGGSIRSVLAVSTGSPTIPQIYVGGAHVGGCTDLFDRVGDGTMAARLDELGIAWNRDAEVDAYSLLPSWLHPRQAG
jgi:cysteine synthase A